MSRAVLSFHCAKERASAAAQLLRSGPPFDPEEVGLDRHHVFLTDEEAVFVFEADDLEAAERLIGGETFWKAAAAWKDSSPGPRASPRTPTPGCVRRVSGHISYRAAHPGRATVTAATSSSPGQ